VSNAIFSYINGVIGNSFFVPSVVVALFIVESFMCVQVILYVEGRVRLLTMLLFTYCKKHMLAGIYLALYPKQTGSL